MDTQGRTARRIVVTTLITLIVTLGLALEPASAGKMTRNQRQSCLAASQPMTAEQRAALEADFLRLYGASIDEICNPTTKGGR